MLQAGVVFPYSAKRLILAEFLRLPGLLCPVRMSVGEDEPDFMLSDSPDVLDELDRRQSGFFLKSKACSYNIELVGTNPIVCTCFLELEASQAKTLLMRLAAAQPLFGFGCLPEEREAKNRVVNNIGVNTIETWVGREIEKAVPGLYWCTILTEVLARKHAIPLSALSAIAFEHLQLGDELHLFRFYEKPEEWTKAKEVSDLSASLPGIFNVEHARAAMAKAKNLKEHWEISEPWVD